MRSPGAVAALALTLAGVAACGGSGPTSPSPPGGGSQTGLRIAGDAVIDFTRGESRALTVEELSGSTYVAKPAANYTWTTSDSSVATVSASGVVTTGPGLGQVVITATAADGKSAVGRLWVQRPENEPSTFRITLIFSDNIPDSWKPHFEWAAARWEQVIRAPLPPATLTNPPSNVCGNSAGAPPIPPLSGTTTGSVILIEWSTVGAGAFGGPCTHRGLPSPTTIFGRVTIARATPDLTNSIRATALHEIGHALGLVAVIQGAQPPWFDLSANRYTGPYALEGHRRQFGSGPAFLDARAGHWWFWPDVMNDGSIGSSVRITKVTVGALMDMNYPVAWYGADTW